MKKLLFCLSVGLFLCVYLDCKDIYASEVSENDAANESEEFILGDPIEAFKEDVSDDDFAFEYVCEETVNDEKTEEVIAFVNRMYEKALGREAEKDGLYNWSLELVNENTDGAGLATGFIGSKEFKNKNLSDEAYVDALYETFFNRPGDQKGKEEWVNLLKGGMPREKVLAGFVNSEEFSNLCDSYNIARGTLGDDGVSYYNKGVRNFVLRNYETVLDRKGESAGIEYWAGTINKALPSDKSRVMTEVSTNGFYNSREFLNRNLSDEEFVRSLYKTFLDRQPDTAGNNYWIKALNDGKSREDIIKGFGYSPEFMMIISKSLSGNNKTYDKDISVDSYFDDGKKTDDGVSKDGINDNDSSKNVNDFGIITMNNGYWHSIEAKERYERAKREGDYALSGLIGQIEHPFEWPENFIKREFGVTREEMAANREYYYDKYVRKVYGQ